MVRPDHRRPRREDLHLSGLFDRGAAGDRPPGGLVRGPPLRRRRGARRAAALAYQLLDLRGATGIAKLVSMSFDPASYVFTQPSAPTAIRASTVLPARRENVELRTSDGHRLVGELAAPGIRRDQGNTHHAAPAADARRLHGFARLPQGLLPAAGPRRNRRPALQHPRHRPRRGEPAREPSRKASASVSTSRPPCSSPWTAACRTGGWWAGPSAPSLP